jgi:hypothetical protein
MQRFLFHCRSAHLQGDATTNVVLIMACRSEERMKDARKQLEREFDDVFRSGNIRIEELLVDLADPKSVLRASNDYRER